MGLEPAPPIKQFLVEMPRVYLYQLDRGYVIVIGDDSPYGPPKMEAWMTIEEVEARTKEVLLKAAAKATRLNA